MSLDFYSALAEIEEKRGFSKRPLDYICWPRVQWFQSLVAFPQKEFLCRASLAVKPSLLTLNCEKMLLRCRSWIHRSLSLMRLFHFTEKALALVMRESLLLILFILINECLDFSNTLINLISNYSLPGKHNQHLKLHQEAFFNGKVLSWDDLNFYFILYFVLFPDDLFIKKLYNFKIENQIISSHFSCFVNQTKVNFYLRSAAQVCGKDGGFKRLVNFRSSARNNWQPSMLIAQHRRREWEYTNASSWKSPHRNIHPHFHFSKLDRLNSHTHTHGRCVTCVFSLKKPPCVYDIVHKPARDATITRSYYFLNPNTCWVNRGSAVCCARKRQLMN